MRDAWRSTYDAWKLRSDRDDMLPDEFDDYDARSDAVLSYYAAIEAKRNRGDHLLEGKPMGNQDQPSDFSADLTNMIGKYLEAGTTADEIAAALQEAIEEIEGAAVEESSDELAGEDEGKPDDDEMT